MSSQLRSIPQNSKYHTAFAELYAIGEILIYDGRFTNYNLPNPYPIRLTSWGIEKARNWIKVFDFEYPRNQENQPKSSTMITIDEMIEHITFIEVLVAENKKEKNETVYKNEVI